eukprot:52355-Eustigmatos_ZCMA.PRE.1
MAVLTLTAGHGKLREVRSFAPRPGLTAGDTTPKDIQGRTHTAFGVFKRDHDAVDRYSTQPLTA